MVLKVCRTCGRDYIACRDTVRDPNGSFRWQEVACSPECGTLYFKEILKSRGKLVSEPTTDAEKEVHADIDNDEFDESDSVFQDDPEELDQ